MDFTNTIRQVLSSYSAVVKEKKGLYTAEITIADRKAFLSRKKLVYIAKFRIDDSKKQMRFSEMLKETGFGLSGADIDRSPGFGFKKETYKTGSGPREGTITEQSRLFGKKYRYSFDFATIRTAIEEKAREAGYIFEYKILL
jgi:hypothetical protein